MGETMTMLDQAVAAANSTLDDFDMFGEHRLVAREIARAVIASLREPSVEMAEAGANYAECGSVWSADLCWRAMIDAILEEPKA